MTTTTKAIPLTLVKSTGGTHVYGNEDMGLKSIYIPKLLCPVPTPPVPWPQGLLAPCAPAPFVALREEPHA